MVHWMPNETKAIRARNLAERAAGHPLENIELLSAACQLAPQLYRLRGEAFNVVNVWQLLGAGERQVYIDLCIELLREVEPERGAVVQFPERHV